MATTTKRLQFTQTDMPDLDVHRSIRRATAAGDRSELTKEGLPRKRKLRKERETAANTLRKERRVKSSHTSDSDQRKSRLQTAPQAAQNVKGTSGTASHAQQLRFAEMSPANRRGTVRSAVKSFATESSASAQQLIRQQNQDENTGVQAAQFTEEGAEHTLHAVDNALYSHRIRQFANADKLEKKADRTNINALYRQSLKDHPKTASNPLSRWRQKQNIKKQYLAMKHSYTSTAASASQKAASGVKTVADRLLHYSRSHSHILITAAAVALLLMVISGSVSSCSAIFSGVSNGVLATSFTAETEDILGAEADYSAKEGALRTRIRQLQQSGYDEYQLNIDEIGHNPWELAALLTVLKENYTRSEVQGLLQQIFDAQYGLTTQVSTETVTHTKTVTVGESLGIVTTSAYCSCPICCGQWSGGPTASGVYPKANHTLAVDARNPFVPMGTKVVMNGVEYTVEDTGNFARFGVQFDVYYDSHQAALQHGHQDWECYLADSNGSNTIEVTTTETIRVCNITLVNHGLRSALDHMGLSADQLERFEILMQTNGNRSDLFSDNIYANSVGGYLSYDIPGEALTDERFRKMITEAEKYLGYPYVWGGSSPETSFDCSGYVSWVINHCGNGWSIGRQTAESLRGFCDIIPKSEARPGDLIFFKGTYDTTGASHVGIYVGGDMMIHCGQPISYASIATPYWQEHFYCMGRIR